MLHERFSEAGRASPKGCQLALMTAWASLARDRSAAVRTWV